MAQFFIYLKTEVRSLLKQTPQVLAVYLFLPLIFSALMGFSFSTAFVPDVTIDPVLIHVENQDEGHQGEMLVEVFENEEIQDYFERVPKEDADFEVTIHSDYSDALEETRITIEAVPNASANDRTILSSFITEWQQASVDQEVLMAELATVENPETIADLQATIESISMIETSQVFTEETYDSGNALTSYQFSSVTGLMYILFMTLSTSVVMKTNKDFKGLQKRVGILPLTPAESVLYDVGTNTLIYTVMIGLFIIIWRLVDSGTFTGNPLFYLVWVILYTLFFQALNAVLRYLVPGKIAGIFYQVMLMLYMVLGFLPVDKMIGGRLGELFSQNFIRQLFNQPMYDYILNQEFFENTPIAIGLFISTIVIISGTIIIRHRRELSPA